MKRQKDNFTVDFIANGYTTNADFLDCTPRNGYVARLKADTEFRYIFRDIWDAYEKPSDRKVYAWEWCKALCKALHGENIRITSRNCMVFSVAFEFYHPETGAFCSALITRDYNRFAYITE